MPAITLATAWGGCTLGPDFVKPEVETGADFKEASGAADVPPEGDWWKAFNDPGLKRLISDLEESNPTLEAALARHDAANAAYGSAKSLRWPEVIGDGRIERERATTSGTFVPDPATNNLFEAGLGLEYEVDLWGRVRRSVESAQRDLLASEADVAAVLLSLKAEMASTWYQLRFADEEIAILEKALEVRAENRDLIDARVRGGESTDLDLARAKTEYETNRAQLRQVQRLRDTLVHALAALAGKPPANFELPAIRNPRPPPKIPAGIPSELLTRRPDVAADEQRLAAAVARIGAEKATFFPRLTLTGRGGLSSIEAADFLQPTSLFGKMGPNLSIPINQGGRIESEIDRVEAEAREALAAYRQTVLTAIRETEDALSDIRWLDQEIDAHEKAVSSAADAARLSRRRYEGGLVSYLEVVDAERTRLSESRELTRTRSARQLATVQLIQALGGGWETP